MTQKFQKLQKKFKELENIDKENEKLKVVYDKVENGETLNLNFFKKPQSQQTSSKSTYTSPFWITTTHGVLNMHRGNSNKEKNDIEFLLDDVTVISILNVIKKRLNIMRKEILEEIKELNKVCLEE